MRPEEWANQMMSEGNYPGVSRNELIALYHTQRRELDAMIRTQPVRTAKDRENDMSRGMGA